MDDLHSSLGSIHLSFWRIDLHHVELAFVWTMYIRLRNLIVVHLERLTSI